MIMKRPLLFVFSSYTCLILSLIYNDYCYGEKLGRERKGKKREKSFSERESEKKERFFERKLKAFFFSPLPDRTQNLTSFLF